MAGWLSMHDHSAEPQFLCLASDLAETGDAVVFEVVAFGVARPVQAFAVRYQGRVVAYLNQCAHVPTEMDWQPGKFWDMDRRFFICSIHGALYDPPNGLCVSGPCRGAHLQKIAGQEIDQKVYWYPSEQFQPVF